MIKKSHLISLTERIAPPVYSIIADITQLFPGLASEYLDGDQMIKACMTACGEKEGLHAVTEGWTTPEGVEIHQDTFNKHLGVIMSSSVVQIESKLQQIYDHQLREALKGQNGELVAAIDYHEEKVYLKDVEKSPLSQFVVGRPKVDTYGNKKGKQYKLRYLTCSLVQPFHQVIAVHFVGPLNDSNEVFQQMVSHVRDTHGIKKYLLDRGFYSYDVIHWFESKSKCSYLMPVPKTSGVKPLLERLENERLRRYHGTYADFFENEPHTVSGSSYGKASKHDIELKVIVAKNYMLHLKKVHFSLKDKRIRKAFQDSKLIAFATNDPDMISSKIINDNYRKRWRIENGYRELKQLLPKTKTPKVQLRIFWFNLAALLENTWERARREDNSITIYKFRKALCAICQQAPHESYELIEADARRRGVLSSMFDLMKKTNMGYTAP